MLTDAEQLRLECIAATKELLTEGIVQTITMSEFLEMTKEMYAFVTTGKVKKAK